MNSRVAFCAICAVAALLFCSGCDEHWTYQQSLTLIIASGTSHVAPGDTAYFVITSKAANCDPTFRYLMHWGDSITSTANPHVPGDTYRMHHAYKYPGNYDVWADAKINAESSSIVVHASAHWTMHVSSSFDPVIDSAQFNCQWRPIELVVCASDPAGESLRLAVQWGDSLSDTTDFQGSPCRLTASHRYADSGQVEVVFRVLNKAGTGSAPDTLTGEADAGGEVIKLLAGAYSGSPVVAGDITYVVGPDGLYGLSDTSTLYVYPGSFVGQPSVSSQTLHGYIGSEDGHLHAFTQEIVPVWEYPPLDSITGWQWGPVAVNGNALYVPCSNDSVYCLLDNGDSVTRGAAFAVGPVEAVVLDATGNVYFGGDSGYLYKLTAGLNLVWRSRVQSQGIVLGPVIGAGGTIYCSSESKRVCAVDPGDGSIIWQQILGDVSYRLVVGSDGLYAASASGVLYKLGLADGKILWESRLGIEGLSAAPVLATGGYLYVQTDDDRLYCIQQLTGDSAWVCNAYRYLTRGRRIHPTSAISSPTLNASGRVCVVGDGAFYVLNTQSELDFTSPWPKWQHDLYNTGYVGGGR